MLITECTMETTASPEAIWAIWADVENWKSWDHGIEFSRIEGPFVTGTRGELKPKGGPLVRTQLTQVEPMKGFVDVAKLPLTRIVVSHTIGHVGEQRTVTHRIEMKGILSPLFAYLIGRPMKKNLPVEMAAMIRKAEESS